MRRLHLALGAIVALFPAFAASCAGNNPPPQSAAPTQPSVLVTSTLAPPIATLPSATAQASPAPATPARPASAPPPATAIAAGPACTQIGQTWTSPVDGVTLVCVPAGEFVMGAADDDSLAEDHEKPQHRVYLDAFWIDRTEVTNANFAKCMAAGACRPKIYEVSAMTYTPYAVHPDYQDYPAFLYEADVAEAYCRWARRRLPTEAEWEKAARGTDGRLYPWGNTLDCSKANYYGCDITPKPSSVAAPHCPNSALCQTTSVDAYPAGASPYGALNMAGNVWEWVSDWYSPVYYAYSPSKNPTGPDAGEFKVRRGGGAKSLPQDLRVTSRVSGSPQHYFDDQMGFRCAAGAPAP